MFGKFLEDVAGVVTDAAKIVTVPIAVTVLVAREITKPIAKVATEAMEEIRGKAK